MNVDDFTDLTLMACLVSPITGIVAGAAVDSPTLAAAGVLGAVVSVALTLFALATCDDLEDPVRLTPGGDGR